VIATLGRRAKLVSTAAPPSAQIKLCGGALVVGTCCFLDMPLLELPARS
jgi:hypothetical protein